VSSIRVSFGWELRRSHRRLQDQRTAVNPTGNNKYRGGDFSLSSTQQHLEDLPTQRTHRSRKLDCSQSKNSLWRITGTSIATPTVGSSKRTNAKIKTKRPARRSASRRQSCAVRSRSTPRDGRRATNPESLLAAGDLVSHHYSVLDRAAPSRVSLSGSRRKNGLEEQRTGYLEEHPSANHDGVNATLSLTKLELKFFRS